MQRSGVLHIEGMESRLDHILLARQGSTNPVGEGTKFLEVTCQVGDGDTVTVEGISDKIGRDDVIYVRNAWRIEPMSNGEAGERLAPSPPPVMKPAVEWTAPTHHKPVKRAAAPAPSKAPVAALAPVASEVTIPAVAPEPPEEIPLVSAAKKTGTKKQAPKKAAAKEGALKKAAPRKAAPKRSGKKRAPKKAAPERSGANKLRFKNNKAKTSRRGKAGRK